MGDLYDYDDISEKTKQYVIENLNEDPSNVNECIRSLRTWVKSMPHLTCPTDCKFLLRFLRVTKFDLEKAKQRLDNFCTIRCSKRGSYNYFNRQSIDDALIGEFLESQIVTSLGSNEDGELTILLMLKNWNIDKFSREKWSILAVMVYDVILAEEADIYGVRFYVDLTGASRKVAKAVGDGEYMKHVQSILQDCYPWRLKGVIFANAPKIFDPYLKMWSFYKNDEQENFFVEIKKEAQHEIDNIPGLRNILPTECGGLAGPLKPISDRMSQKFKDYYKNGDPLGGDLVDESKRHPETWDYFKQYPEYHGPCYDTDCSDG